MRQKLGVGRVWESLLHRKLYFKLYRLSLALNNHLTNDSYFLFHSCLYQQHSTQQTLVFKTNRPTLTNRLRCLRHLGCQRILSRCHLSHITCLLCLKPHLHQQLNMFLMLFSLARFLASPFVDSQIVQPWG